MCKIHYQKFTCSHRILIDTHKCGSKIIAWFNEGICMQGIHTEYIATLCEECRRPETDCNTPFVSSPSSPTSSSFLSSEQEEETTPFLSPSAESEQDIDTGSHLTIPASPANLTRRQSAPMAPPNLAIPEFKPGHIRRRTFDIPHSSSPLSNICWDSVLLDFHTYLHRPIYTDIVPDWDAEMREFEERLDKRVVPEIRVGRGGYDGKKMSVQEMVEDACAFDIGSWMKI